MGLWAVLREDCRTHRGKWTEPGLHAIWMHRVGVYATTAITPLRWALTVFYYFCHIFCRNFYGIELPRTIQIGRRLQIGHQNGIVIHSSARIGDDCIIRQCVTFGVGNEWIPGKGPIIGNNVTFGVGTVVMGNITIGDNVSIGPNCVISSDVPSNRSLFVPPPRVLPKETEVAAES
jgi:serine O-acetyltransferase